jgi:bacillithiol system protein YtxJ
MTEGTMVRLAGTTAAAWLGSLPERTPVLLYKHSPICGSSRRAQLEVMEFMAAHPALRVFQLDVIAERVLARDLAARLGVVHESPQAILLSGRSVIWHGAHGDVSVDPLEAALDATSDVRRQE